VGTTNSLQEQHHKTSAPLVRDPNVSNINVQVV
jgi:hypothetical protein